MENEAPSTNPPKCRDCHSPIQWRCHDCFGDPDLCTLCCVAAHRYLPFHRVSMWSGDCFVRSSLRHTGLTLYLGHKGLPCAGARSDTTDRDTSLDPSPTHSSPHNATQVENSVMRAVSVDSDTRFRRSASPEDEQGCSLSHALTDTLSLNPTLITPPETVQSSLPSPQSLDSCATPPASSLTSVTVANNVISGTDSTTESTLHNTGSTRAETAKERDDIPKGFNENGDPWLTIVDISGVHHLPMHSCICDGCSEPIFVQLLRLSLYPCTTERPRTVFTFRLLNDFDLENLETKASAQSFYAKLRRITNNVSPHLVPDRYRELMRVLREWRNLMSLKRSGYGHHTSESTSQMPPPQGGLALFCPACPQPAINLPQSWANDPSK